MTQEENQLLFQDLCVRLPYHVQCKIWLKDGITEEGPLDLEHNYADVLLNAFYYDDIKDIKPYLHPMSSMTEEERDELELLCDGLDIDDEGNSSYYMSIIKNHKSNTINFKIIDFLISYHFDYRGLIEKGLALEAPEGMYNIKKK